MFHNIIFFLEKYDFVGRLLKPGEQPTNYSDEEDEQPSVTAEQPSVTAEKKKDD